MRSHRPRAEQTAEASHAARLATSYRSCVPFPRAIRADLWSARPVNGRHRCASGLGGAVVAIKPPWRTNGGTSDAPSSTTSRADG